MTGPARGEGAGHVGGLCPGGDPRAGVPQVEELREQVANLRRALASRPVIEQAKGVLMLRYRIDERAAFAVLGRVSQRSNIKVRHIAAIVCQVAAGGGYPEAGADPVLAGVLDQLAGAAPIARAAGYAEDTGPDRQAGTGVGPR